MNKKTKKEYRIWRAMKARCYAPSQTHGYYKAEGITVCDRWRNSFDAFMEDMGPIPDDTYSIERIDPHGRYEPSNCKWILRSEQPKNRRTSIMFSLGGHTACLKDWVRCFGLNYPTVYSRIKKYGYSIEKALEIPNDLKAVDTAIREYYGMEGGDGGEN